MICPHCQNEVPNGNFCSVCGYSILDTPAPERPGNHLVLSIISAMIFLPLGIAAIIYAARVDSLYDRGEYEAALHSSRVAGTLCFVAFLPYILVALLMLLTLCCPRT